MKKQNVRTLSLIVATFTYLLIGAAVFDVIESEEEQRQHEALDNLYVQMKIKFKISDEDLDLLEEIIPLQQPYKAGKPWKFAGAFYYATTVLTTIGYGHSTPKTTGGKFFTMVYAIVGIPLGLVMFNSIGERLNNFSSIVINKVRKTLKAKQTEATEMDLILIVSTLSGIVTTTGAAAFSHYEGWSYFNSIYYCFVTLTTIGFGDFVALQQDNSLENKPEYVTFALFFIMFGLAIIAASLNLMVLKFMTMNTEDEKRDVQEAIQAAAQNVRLDGDIILQQNDVLHWQAEGMGSLEELRSVCSCACDACLYNPFQRTSERARDSHDPNCANNMVPLIDGNGPTRASTAMRWYSTDSLRTSATAAATPGGNYSSNSRPTTPGHTCNNSGGARRHPKVCNNEHNCDSERLIASVSGCKQRAESVHDLRKFEHPLPVMKLRTKPRETRTEMRPKKQLFVTRLEPAEVAARTDIGQSSGWSAKKFIQRNIFRNRRQSEAETTTGTSPKRECYVLEELACIEVVPVEDNHYERVSL